MNEQELQSIIQKSPAVSLSQQERAEAKAHIFAVVKKYPRRYQKPRQLDWKLQSLSWMSTHRIATAALLAVVLVVFAGTGVTLAAQQSLPGDLIYPVKTDVNEKVLSWFAVSDQAKAQYDLGLVQLRLQEAETVALQHKLDANTSQKIQALLNTHIQDIQTHIKKVQGANQLAVSVQTNSDLEASLNAHAHVMATIAQQQPGITTTGIQKFVLDVEDQNAQVSTSRKQEESNLSHAESKSDAGKQATAAFKQIDHRIDQIAIFVDNKKSDISEATYQRALADIAAANNSVEQGDAQLANQDFAGAAIAFQTALRTIQEVKIYVQAEAKLSSQLQISGSDSAADSGEHGDSSGNSQDGHKDSQPDTQEVPSVLHIGL